MKPDPLNKVKPTNSTQAPAIDQDAPETLARMTSLEVSFFGGDPAFGTPVATLQVKNSDGSFTDVKKNGWIPVSNAHGYEMKSFYVATPTYRAEPNVTARSHHWMIHYEPGQDLPAGQYRLHFAGGWQDNGAAKDYTLDSKVFEVVPSTSLHIDGKLAVVGDQIVFDGTLLYPQQGFVGAPKPSTGWQIDHFRLYTPRYGNGFSPAKATTTLPSGTIARDQTGETSVSLSFVDREVERSKLTYAPGEGPGLHAVITSTGSGDYVLSLPAIEDEFGNTAPPTTFNVTVQ
jgi:hypothetical protein